MDNKKANIISTISVIAAFVIPLFMDLFNGIFSADIGFVITIIAKMTAWGSRIAALILMIYVRVKYPDNVFGKVIMWIYIVFIAIALIILAIVMISCGIAFGSCVNGIQGCGEMGIRLMGTSWK